MDEYTIPEANELFREWKDHPPVYILVKAVFGAESAEKQITDSEINELRRSAGNSLPIVPGKAIKHPRTAAIFDFEQLRKLNESVAKNVRKSR